MLGGLLEVYVAIGWILVPELEHPPDGGFVPFPAGIVKLPVPPGIPGPRILVPLVAGGVRRILIIGLGQGECPEVRNNALFTGPWWLRGLRLGVSLGLSNNIARLTRRRVHLLLAGRTALAPLVARILHGTPLRLRVAGGSNLS